jgi:hypothetical protein
MQRARELVARMILLQGDIGILNSQFSGVKAELEKELLEFYTATRAATMLGVAHNTIIRRIKNGKYLGGLIGSTYYTLRSYIDEELDMRISFTP